MEGMFLMSFIEIFLIGISLSMDAAAVSMSNGMCVKRIGAGLALKIALFFGLFQGMMPAIGYFGASIFEKQIKMIDHWLALILLTIIGGKMLYEALKKDEEKEECPVVLTDRILFVQAIATSIDALAVGIGFAALDIEIFSAVSIISVITFVLCFISVYIGKKFGSLLNKKAEILGGLILISIGAKIFIEHIITE